MILAPGTLMGTKGAGSGSPLWTPSQLTTLAWYDMSTDTDITLDVSPNISALNDKSGNARHLAKGPAAEQPHWDSVNGYVQFETGHHFSHGGAGVDFIYNNGNYMVFMVVDADTFADNCYLFSEGYTDDRVFGPAIVSPTNDIKAFIRPQSGITIISGVSGDIGTGVWYDGFQILSIEDTGTHMAARRNGGTISAIPYTRSGTFISDKFTIGGLDRSSFSNGCAMKMKEFIVTSHLSDTDRQLIEGYLAHRHGLAGDLDVSHPYKSSAPTV